MLKNKTRPNRHYLRNLISEINSGSPHRWCVNYKSANQFSLSLKYVRDQNEQLMQHLVVDNIGKRSVFISFNCWGGELKSTHVASLTLFRTTYFSIHYFHVQRELAIFNYTWTLCSLTYLSPQVCTLFVSCKLPPSKVVLFNFHKWTSGDTKTNWFIVRNSMDYRKHRMNFENTLLWNTWVQRAMSIPFH